ncbi:MAG: DUF5642 family protein [Mycolicibacterium rufum]|nr:DUF5642 family protein [Mycolicibacterium rufum]
MRLLALGAVAVWCTACGSPGPPPSTTTPAAPTVTAVNPARVDRSRSALPEGYEVSAYTGRPAPVALWGLRDPADADPPQCAALASPAVDTATARGWSASGAGGIAYAVVAAAPGGPGPLPDDCARWTVSSGPTTATVREVPAPDVDAARTVGLRTDATTVVEGGTETRSHADTFIAYLGDYICVVALVTDPGSPHPALGPEFASHLLTETVSALRG